jgi:hypothetical protein
MTDREKEWVECENCGGSGAVLNDCGEDCCCCSDPELSHGYHTCETCQGKGGWWRQ